MIIRFRPALAASLLAMLVVGLSPAGATQSEDIVFGDSSLSGNYLAGRFAGKQRDMDAAAQFFSQALDDDPGNARLVERTFILELSAGNLDRAEELAAQVVEANKRHRMAQLVLGLKAAREKHFAGAVRHFEKAAYTPIGELTAHLLIAWSEAGAGHLDKALKALDKLDANEAFANFKLYHGALITDLLAGGVRAEKPYKAAYDTAGTSLRIVQAYGNYLQRTDRTDEAIKVYEGFLARSPGNPLVASALENARAGLKPSRFVASAEDGLAETMFGIASALTDEQSIDVALIYDQLALSLKPDFGVGQTLLGEIYENTNRFEKAIDAYDAVPHGSPLKISADIQVASSLNSLDKPDEAIKRLNGLLERHHGNFDALVTLGNIQRGHERWSDAAKSYTRAIDEMTPQQRETDWTLFYFRGIAYERAGEWDKAEPDFKEALKMQPDQPAVLNYLGYSWIEKGLNLDEALDMVKRAVELRPNDGYIVDSLGWAYYQLGNYQDAVRELERAIELKPEDPVINEHLGDAYWRVGRHLEARFQWSHALASDPEAKLIPEIEKKLKDGLPELPANPASAQENPPGKS